MTISASNWVTRYLHTYSINLTVSSLSQSNHFLAHPALVNSFGIMIEISTTTISLCPAALQHCPKKKFVNGNVFLDGRKCLSIHEEMFLWVLITSMERKKLSCWKKMFPSRFLFPCKENFRWLPSPHPHPPSHPKKTFFPWQQKPGGGGRGGRKPV